MADGSDLNACFDGTCEVLIAAFPAQVPLDSSLGLRQGLQGLTFQAISSDGDVPVIPVAFVGPGGGTMGTVTMYVDGTASFNGLTIDILAIHEGTAADASPPSDR